MAGAGFWILDSDWPHLRPAAAPPDLIGQSSPLGQRYSHMGRVGKEKAGARQSKAVSLWDVGVGGGAKKLDVIRSPSIYRKPIPDVGQVVGSSRRWVASKAANSIQTVYCIFLVKSPEIKKIQAFSNSSSKRYFNTFLLCCVIVVVVARRVVNNGYSFHTP